MKLIDTHCHLNAEDFDQHVRERIQQANREQVAHMFVVGWDQNSSVKAIMLSQQHDQLKAIIGLHPVESGLNSDLTWIKPLRQKHLREIIAIGEIGLDYYWKKTEEERSIQERDFIAQINIANELNLPIVVHCRDAYEQTLKVLQWHTPIHGGVMHCYAGPKELVKDFVAIGMYISFGGPITFKNAHEAREALIATPLDRLLIETDAPYLAPHPFRGKQNTPSYLPLIFEKVSELTQINKELLADKLFTNSEKAFHVKL
jgi:TatD DNase family protein